MTDPTVCTNEETYQGGASRDRGGAAVLTICIVVPQGQLDLLSLLHRSNSSVPAFDDVAGAQGEAEWVASVHGGVKLGAVSERTRVVHCRSTQCESVLTPLAPYHSICYGMLCARQ